MEVFAWMSFFFYRQQAKSSSKVLFHTDHIPRTFSSMAFLLLNETGILVEGIFVSPVLRWLHFRMSFLVLRKIRLTVENFFAFVALIRIVFSVNSGADKWRLQLEGFLPAFFRPFSNVNLTALNKVRILAKGFPAFVVLRRLLQCELPLVWCKIRAELSLKGLLHSEHSLYFYPECLCDKTERP